MCELVLIHVHQLGLIIDKDSHSVIFIQIHHHRLTGLSNPRTTCYFLELVGPDNEMYLD